MNYLSLCNLPSRELIYETFGFYVTGLSGRVQNRTKLILLNKNFYRGEIHVGVLKCMYTHPRKYFLFGMSVCVYKMHYKVMSLKNK